MNDDVKVYCIAFFGRGVNLWALAQYLYDSADILAYWNYIPLVYCVKSRLSATELSIKLRVFFPEGQPPQGCFMIAEINVRNLNGILPKEAWDWFYLPHHEKSHPPSFPHGLFGLEGLSGSAHDLGLLLKPPERK